MQLVIKFTVLGSNTEDWSIPEDIARFYTQYILCSTSILLLIRNPHPNIKKKL